MIIAWAIRESYHRTLGFTPGRAVFGRAVLFNLTSLLDWFVITAENQRQVDIHSAHKNARRVKHDYAVGDLFYVDKSSIYRKRDLKNHGPYRITEFFTNGTVRFQRVAINKQINIRRLEPHFDSVESMP